MVYCTGPNSPIKIETIAPVKRWEFCQNTPRISGLIGNFWRAKRVLLGGRGEVDCSWENQYSLAYPGEELTYASGEEHLRVR